MKRTTPVSIAFLLLAALVWLPTALQAATEVGRVLASSGQFIARQADGSERMLHRRSVIYEQDLLVTAANSRAQIRFKDNSLLELQSSTEFRVDQFSFGDEVVKESAAFSLLKGGMRTVTGAIGKRDKENYKVITPVATIGIRGTHYHLRWCDGGCGAAGEGLFGKVVNGRILLRNASGEHTFGRNEFFRLDSATSAPITLDSLPMEFFNGGDEGAGDQESPEGRADEGLGDGEEGQDSGDWGSEQGVEPAIVDGDQGSESWGVDGLVLWDTTTDISIDQTYQVTQNIIAAGGGATANDGIRADLNSWGGVGFSLSEPDGENHGVGGSVIEGVNGIFNWDTVNGVGYVPVYGEVYGANCYPCVFSNGTASLSNTGGASISGKYAVNWGRWDGNYLIVTNGVLAQTGPYLHYAYADAIHRTQDWSEANACGGSAPACTSGVATFLTNSFIGTAPTDHQGNMGALSSGSVTVDFGAQKITGVNLVATVNSITYKIDTVDPSGPTSLDAVVGSGASLRLSDSGGVMEGEMGLTLVGPQAQGLLGVYGINRIGGVEAVSGAALFQR